MFFKLFILSIFNDFFNDLIFLNIININQSINFIESNYYITSSTFISLESTSGGALYCIQSNKIVIENSLFIKCKSTSSHGGAIYFEMSNGGSALNKICAFNCSTPKPFSFDGQFAHI